MAPRKTRKRVPTDVNFQLQAELARMRVLDGSTADIWGRPCALQDAGQSSRPNPLDARNPPPPALTTRKVCGCCHMGSGGQNCSSLRTTTYGDERNNGWKVLLNGKGHKGAFRGIGNVLDPA